MATKVMTIVWLSIMVTVMCVVVRHYHAKQLANSFMLCQKDEHLEIYTDGTQSCIYDWWGSGSSPMCDYSVVPNAEAGLWQFALNDHRECWLKI